MLGILTRRRLFARSVAGLLGWAGFSLTLRPGQAAPACPHPLHLPLCADRPGPGLWFKTYLRLTCPICQETVHQRGYLPDTSYADCRAVLPPDWPVATAAPSQVLTYDCSPAPGSCIRTTCYDAAGNIPAFPNGGPF